MKKAQKAGRASKTIAPEKYGEVYELVKTGLSDKDVAERFGLKKSHLREQRDKDKALDSLITTARQMTRPRGAGEGNFEEYVYGHLDPRARKHWDKIMEVWKSKASPDRRDKLRQVLKGTQNASKNVRQGLFVHAWIKTGFNGTQASMLSGVPYRTYMAWAKFDPHFQHLLEEIDWHRKNFFESALIKLVRKGNPAAVVHAAKTQLADRGYGTKVEFTGQMTHTHEDRVTVEDLNLDLDTRKKLFKALQEKERKERKALPAHDSDVQDAEVISVKPARRRKKLP